MTAAAQLDLIPQPTVRRGPDHRAARVRREFGMDRVADATERLNRGWFEKAMERLRAFVKPQAGVFTMEQARAVLESELPEPSDARVWGPLTKMAVAAHVIEPTKLFAPAASSNGSPKRMYRKGVAC